MTGFGAPRWRVNFVRGVLYPEVVHIGPAVEVDLKNEEIGMTLHYTFAEDGLVVRLKLYNNQCDRIWRNFDILAIF